MIRAAENDATLAAYAIEGSARKNEQPNTHAASVIPTPEGQFYKVTQYHDEQTG